VTTTCTRSLGGRARTRKRWPGSSSRRHNCRSERVRRWSARPGTMHVCLPSCRALCVCSDDLCWRGSRCNGGGHVGDGGSASDPARRSA
jgi:hypothetical protein